MIYVILWNFIKYLTKITCHHVFFQLSSLIWLWVLDFLSSLSCCRDVASTGWNTCAAALEAYQQHRAIPSVWPLQSCLQVRTVLRHPAYRGNAPICNEHIQATQIPIQMQIGTITFVTKMSHNSWHLCKLGSVINVRVCVCVRRWCRVNVCTLFIYIYITYSLLIQMYATTFCQSPANSESHSGSAGAAGDGHLRCGIAPHASNLWTAPPAAVYALLRT